MIETKTAAGAYAYSLLEQASADPPLAMGLARQLGLMYQNEQDPVARSEIGDVQSQLLKLAPDDTITGQMGSAT
jgi:hypothetical protein